MSDRQCFARAGGRLVGQIWVEEDPSPKLEPISFGFEKGYQTKSNKKKKKKKKGYQTKA